MSGFEIVFSLFVLLLGLGQAEGLGGLARALKVSHKAQIGCMIWLIAHLVLRP